MHHVRPTAIMDGATRATDSEKTAMTVINELDAAIRDLVSSASTVDPWFCVLAVLVLLSLETSLLVGLVLPGEIVLFLAGGVLGGEWALPLFAAAVLANLIGQTGGYWLGRALGPGIRRTRAGRLLGRRRWDAAEAVVHGSGARALITTRFVAVVHAVVPVVVGTLRLPFRRFVLLAAAGATLWAAVLTSLAVGLGEAARAVGYGWSALLFTCVGGGTAALLLTRSIRRRNRPADPADQPSPDATNDPG